MTGRLAAGALRELCGRRSVISASHGVGTSPPGDDPHGLRIPEKQFSEQLRLLKAAGFQFVTVAQLVEGMNGSPPGPGRIALSFDDGLEDNHSLLLPVLREENIPATVYVATGFMGKPNPFMSSGTRQRMMTEEELRDLVAAGWELGAHTVTHPDLSKLSEAECRREMAASRARVEDIAGVAVTTFAYPFCRYGPAAMAAAKAEGFQAALTCEGRGGWHPLETKRSMITASDGLPTFVAKLWDVYQPMFDSVAGRALRGVSRPVRRRIRRG